MAMDFVKLNYVALFGIMFKMINTQNLFARREALKLINVVIREEYLKEVKEAFVSSVVHLSTKDIG